MRVFAGIDIGGTAIKILTVSSTGRVFARGAIDTMPAEGPSHAFRRIADALRSLSRGHEIAAAGIGCAGLIDVRKGWLRESPNLPAWNATPLARVARRALDVYITIDNDATSAAYGEYRKGSLRNVRNLVFITLGTGVGGGVIVDGRVLRGAGNYAGEIGHTVINEDGPRCRCGARGCLEAYAGTYAMVRDVRAALAQRRSRYLTRWVADGEPLTPRLIMDAARRGDAVAKRVVRSAGEHLGTGIASMINVFNPEAVVIGGGVAASLDLLLPHIERVVARRAFEQSAAMARIVASRLGNDATAVGAALFARDNLKSP